MVTYAGEAPANLNEALKSLAQQTRPADATVLVCAGPLTDALEAVVAIHAEALRLNRVDLPENGPLSQSLNAGLAAISTDWVARMDSDDIALPDRFEKQFAYIEAHPEVDVLGTAIAEFATDPSRPTGRRNVPLTQADISRSAFLRTPFNHMTVVFRKGAVERVGGYRDYLGYEDFDLWTRMLADGAQMANLAEPLVMARTGAAFHGRRGGFAYAFAEWRALSAANRINRINPWKVRLSMPFRFLMRITPAGVRNLAYRLVRN